MDTLDAFEQFSTDADVGDFSLRQDGSSNREGPLRVIRRFANPPLTFGIRSVSRNDGAGHSFETANAVRIPALHAALREPLGLLADSVAGGDALQASRDPISDCDRHV